MATTRTPEYRTQTVGPGPITRESFRTGPYRRRTVGLFGELEGGADPQTRYRMPQFDREQLGALDEGQLAQLLEQTRSRYNGLEQEWRTVLPDGYTGIYDEENNLSGPDPMALPENQQRTAALTALSNGQSAIAAEIAARGQMARRDENRLMGGIAEAGYSFAPGSLADRSIIDEIMQSRSNLPGFLKRQAAERNYIRGPNDQNPNGFAWRPFSTGGEDPGVGNPDPYGQQFEPGQYSNAPYYNPSDPLGQANYDAQGGPGYNYDPSGDVFGPPPYTPQRPVFDPQKMQPASVGPRPAGRVAGGMALRPGVKVRNPFETSVATTRRRTPFG